MHFTVGVFFLLDSLGAENVILCYTCDRAGASLRRSAQVETQKCFQLDSKFLLHS